MLRCNTLRCNLELLHIMSMRASCINQRPFYTAITLSIKTRMYICNEAGSTEVGRLVLIGPKGLNRVPSAVK